MRNKSLMWLLIAVLMGATGVVYYAYNRFMPAPASLAEVKIRVMPNLIAQVETKGFELGAPVFVRIFKQSDELEIWMKKGDVFQLYKIYPICKYSGNLGPKLKDGKFWTVKK